MSTKAATSPPGVVLQCVQKRGAYVAQHKHPIIERARAGHSWTLQFPLFSRPILETSKSLKPLFLQRFVTILWVFLAPPPKPTTRIFSPHNPLTAKVRFVNKVGALFVFKKRSWNPYFYSVSRAKIENAIVFWTLPCPISKPKPFEKILALGGSTCFRPKLSDYDKRQKIYWPLRVDPAHKPPHKVHHKMTAPKPRRTNNQPRHKGKKPARPHSSEVTPTQDEEDKQNQKK